MTRVTRQTNLILLGGLCSVSCTCTTRTIATTRCSKVATRFNLQALSVNKLQKSTSPKLQNVTMVKYTSKHKENEKVFFDNHEYDHVVIEKQFVRI